MEIKELYQIFLHSSGVSTDTRKIKEGSIFFALKGNNFNGNRFAENALENGAVKAVVDDESVKGSNIIHVPDVLRILQELATMHRVQNDFQIIALTGSNGKTTTKELLCHILSKRYNCAATSGNLNNHIGVPLTLLSFEGDIEYGIVEMGANHPGEIARLCEISLPDQGLITNIGKAHLEGFGDIHGVAKAKSELFDHLVSNNGMIYFNSSLNKYLDFKKYSVIKTIAYSGSGDNYRFKVTKIDPYLRLKIFLKDVWIEMNTNLSGLYNAENVLAAAGTAHQNGMSADEIAQGIEDYVPQNNRSQRIKTENNEIISDCYNANPTSMRFAIENLGKLKGRNKICIIGEMNELGDSRSNEHQQVVELLKKFRFNQVFLVGKSFIEIEAPEYPAFSDSEKLINYLKKNPVTGSLVLIKGSRTNQLEKVINYL